MAKFNRDEFKEFIVEKVKAAIDREVISKSDIMNDEISKLENFVQFQILEYVKDRLTSLDILKTFDYDETKWKSLQEDIGKFTSLRDIAMANLWKYLQIEGITSYEYFDDDEYDEYDIDDFENEEDDYIDDEEDD